jgi:hypothetical protein
MSEKNHEKRSPFTVEFQDPSTVSREVTEQILKLTEEDVDSIEPEVNVDEALKYYRDPGCVLLLVRSKDQKIVGYISALPMDRSYTIQHALDPLAVSDPKKLFIESFIIAREFRNIALFLKSTRLFLQRAKELGYSHIAMHARISNGLSNIMQRKFNGVIYRTLDNFVDTGESFDYIEVELK